MLLKARNLPVFVAAKLAKLLLLRGLEDFPWNSARREFVSLFFNNDVIPYHNPHMLEISDAKKVKHEQTDPIRTDLMSEVGFNSFMKKKSKALQIREKIIDSQKKRTQT